ncbi:MAG: RluA family pseudouridine synthase [Dehalococcoidia bacterium]|nr:RluA family pseudouridine synthase [Dehalococcoidia bacterium]MDW8009038.1 RluA family pseudouridine synthase [Chloroflexota bacterium]
MTTLELTADQGGERLDVFLARRVDRLSRSQAQRLIERGLVTVEGEQARAARIVRRGERVTVHLPPPEPLSLEPEPIPLTVLYQDEEVIVLDKPPGMAVHPGPGHPRGTLANALIALFPELGQVGEAFRPGIVHRLDKDTSGLLVVAKTPRAHRHLVEQMKARQVHKVYLALVHGLPRPEQGIIEAPIGRHPRHRQRMAVVEGGREALTRYRVVEPLGDYSLLEVEPVTGRTHQIRVHMAAIGHPVVGDPVYGRPSRLLGRQFLHAHRLAFTLPASGRTVEFQSPLPEDLRRCLEAVRRGEKA